MVDRWITLVEKRLAGAECVLVIMLIVIITNHVSVLTIHIFLGQLDLAQLDSCRHKTVMAQVRWSQTKVVQGCQVQLSKSKHLQATYSSTTALCYQEVLTTTYP